MFTNITIICDRWIYVHTLKNKVLCCNDIQKNKVVWKNTHLIGNLTVYVGFGRWGLCLTGPKGLKNWRCIRSHSYKENIRNKGENLDIDLDKKYENILLGLFTKENFNCLAN